MQELGLTDWFTCQHSDGRTTAIKQTPTRLQVVVSREDGAMWMLYNSPCGQSLVREGHAKTIGLACNAADRAARPRAQRLPQVSPRSSQVHNLILADPKRTLADIGRELGVTRERVRQLVIKLQERGLIEEGFLSDRSKLRRAIIQHEKETEKEAKVKTRNYRKRVWLKMTYVAQRIRLRRMAHIDHLGIVRGYHAPGQEAVCQFDDCMQLVSARGFCRRHYGLLRETGALWVRRSSRRFCSESDCGRYVYARGMCRRHYEAWHRKHPSKSHILPNNTSGYRGVTLNKSTGRWTANIRRPGEKQEHLGSFGSKETAARAYDTAARKYLGERAKLNFPDENIEVVKEKRERHSAHPSGYYGVSWEERRKRWQVRITRNGRHIFVGRFLDLEKAARTYDSAARHYLGTKAQLNFPNEEPAPYVLSTERPRERQKASCSFRSKTSQYRGVSWHRGKERWCACLEVKGKRFRRYFTDEAEAARAYDHLAYAYLGERAVLNFPDEQGSTKK